MLLILFSESIIASGDSEAVKRGRLKICWLSAFGSSNLPPRKISFYSIIKLNYLLTVVFVVPPQPKKKSGITSGPARLKPLSSTPSPNQPKRSRPWKRLAAGTALAVGLGIATWKGRPAVYEAIGTPGFRERARVIRVDRSRADLKKPFEKTTVYEQVRALEQQISILPENINRGDKINLGSNPEKTRHASRKFLDQLILTFGDKDAANLPSSEIAKDPAAYNGRLTDRAKHFGYGLNREAARDYLKRLSPRERLELFRAVKGSFYSLMQGQRVKEKGVWTAKGKDAKVYFEQNYWCLRNLMDEIAAMGTPGTTPGEI